MSKFLNIEISAEDQGQANKMMNALLEKRLVTGGQFIHAPARFWWESKIVDMDYVTITSFTVNKHKQAIVDLVSEISKETVPMVRFIPFEGNLKLLEWIEKTVA